MSGITLVSSEQAYISRTGLLPPSVRLSNRVLLCMLSSLMIHNPIIADGLGFSHFARRYFGNRCFFLLLRVLRCFSSPRSLLASYVFRCGCVHITAHGFPHSDICGSMDMCSLPQLFAACHVLRRLPVPRHPPYALIHLTSSECRH